MKPRDVALSAELHDDEMYVETTALHDDDLGAGARLNSLAALIEGGIGSDVRIARESDRVHSLRAKRTDPPDGFGGFGFVPLAMGFDRLTGTDARCHAIWIRGNEATLEMPDGSRRTIALTLAQ